MKLLLVAINAKYIHSNPAVYSLRAYAGEYGEQISLAEYTINQSIDVMLKGIFRRKPEVLCISCYIWNISIARELAEEVHRVLPDTKIWLGGPEVSYDAKQVLERNPQITGVMRERGRKPSWSWYAIMLTERPGFRKSAESPGAAGTALSGTMAFAGRWIWIRCPLFIRIFPDLITGFFIMSPAGDVLFPAVTAFPPSTGSCVSVPWSW